MFKISYLIIVGIFGSLGAISRYLIYLGCKNNFPITIIPYSTMGINTLGCFLLGVVSLLLEKDIPYYEQIYLGAAMGFLGSFTTFSTFGMELFIMLKSQNYFPLLLYLFLSITLGVLAIFLGRFFVSTL